MQLARNPNDTSSGEMSWRVVELEDLQFLVDVVAPMSVRNLAYIYTIKIYRSTYRVIVQYHRVNAMC